MSRSTLTRDRIVETARQLFNESGTAAVTTNHIAARAGLSPGNLYYYFSNKEEIISELVDRCAERLAQAWQPAKEGPLDTAELQRLLEQRLTVLEEYAGATRELLPLARHLPRVGERYRMLHEQRLAELEHVLRASLEANKAGDPSPEKLRDLCESAWLLGLSIVASVDVVGDPGSRGARHSAELIAALIAAQLGMR